MCRHVGRRSADEDIPQDDPRLYFTVYFRRSRALPDGISVGGAAAQETEPASPSSRSWHNPSLSCAQAVSLAARTLMSRSTADAIPARMPPLPHASPLQQLPSNLVELPAPQHAPMPVSMPTPSSNAAPSGPDSSLSLADLSLDDVPTSVRGAPVELRRIIRKRQNSESAKRCRQRKKLESAQAIEEMLSQAARLHALEAAVTRLSAQLYATQRTIAQLGGQPPFPHHTLPPAPHQVSQQVPKGGCWSPVTHAPQPVPQGIDAHTEQLQSLLGKPGFAPPAKHEELWQ